MPPENSLVEPVHATGALFGWRRVRCEEGSGCVNGAASSPVTPEVFGATLVPADSADSSRPDGSGQATVELTRRSLPRRATPQGNDRLLMLGVLILVTMIIAAWVLGSTLAGQLEDLRASGTSREQLANTDLGSISELRRDLLRLDGIVEAGHDQPIQRDLLIGWINSDVDRVISDAHHSVGSQNGLATRAQALGQIWHGTTAPLVLRATQDPQNVDQRRRAHQQLLDLETRYADLANSLAEERRRRAAQEQARTERLASAVWDTAVLIAAIWFAAVGVLLAGAVLYSRAYRQRQVSAARLSALNGELQVLSRVAELTQNIVMITDGLGRLVWVNRAFTTMTGWSLDEARGHTPGSLLQGEETDPSARGRMRRSLAEGRGFEEELTNYHRDGSSFRVRLDVQPLHSKGEIEPDHYVCVGSDVTTMFEAQTHWRAAKAAADAAARDRSVFLAMLSHEMLTPLNVITGTLALLAHEIDQRERFRLDAAIHSAVEEMRRQITNLLTCSALEGGRWEANSASSDLRVLSDSWVLRAKVAAGERRPRIKVVVEDSVPARLVIPASSVEQLVLNLLHNAITRADGAGVELRMAVEGDGSVLVITVTDFGTGIDPVDLVVLDVMFQHDGGVYRLHRGAGLELSTCAVIARHLGAKVKVSGHEGAGAIFQVLVPLERDDGQDDDSDDAWPEPTAGAANPGGRLTRALPDAARAGAGRAWRKVPVRPGSEEVQSAADARVRVGTSEVYDFGAGELDESRSAVQITAPGSGSVVVQGVSADTAITDQSALRVLIVEDNPINARIAEVLLQRQGVLVQWCENGNDALATVLGSDPFDLILMDVNLPGLDGTEVTRRIRAAALGRQPFVVAHTANALPGDRERFMSSGMNEYLPKPLDQQQLKRVIAEARRRRDRVNATALIPTPRTAGPVPMDDGHIPRVSHALPIDALSGDMRAGLSPREPDALAETVPVAPATTSPATTSPAPDDASDAAAACEALPPVDVAGLVAQIGPDLVGVLVETLVEELPERLAAIGAAIAAGEPDQVRRIVHTLAGSAAAVHAVPLATSGRELERAARAGESDSFAEAFSSVQREAERLSAWVATGFHHGAAGS